MAVMRLRAALALVLLVSAVAAGCAAPAGTPAGDGRTTPVYNKQTGLLEELISDRDGDGKPDTRAFMAGTLVRSVEIDLDGDGQPDRWEYYKAAPAGQAGPASVIDRAEESGDRDRRITRREFYQDGVLVRIEEDTDRDGRPDKWEYFEGDVLTRVELDLDGRGRPDRRLIYGADGNVVRVEADPDGDGTFEPIPASPAQKGRGD
jgi:hypothetical protein